MSSLPNGPTLNPAMRILNGSSPTTSRIDARDNKERERLKNSIYQSRRGSVDVLSADRPSRDSLSNGYPGPQYRNSSVSDGVELVEEESARDPRDTTVARRAESPFTHGPAVDFDGLSWPSESRQGFSPEDPRTDTSQASAPSRD